MQRLHVQGKRRDISIGTYPAVTLSEARERAHDKRLTAKRGVDPSGRASTVPTFAAVSAKVERAGQWRGRTRETRRRTLARYAARLMHRPVDQIDRAAVLPVHGPVYRDKPATGKLLRGWVRGVLAATQALGHVDVNTVGEVIDAALPKTPKARAHRRAFAVRGRSRSAGGGRGVRGRSGRQGGDSLHGADGGAVGRGSRGDVGRGRPRGAGVARTGIADEGRGGNRVPLSDAAVAVLEGMRAHSDGAADSLIFPGVSGRPLNGDTLIKALRRATGTEADVHGFRSSFRTWAAERSGATTEQIASRVNSARQTRRPRVQGPAPRRPPNAAHRSRVTRPRSTQNERSRWPPQARRGVQPYGVEPEPTELEGDRLSPSGWLSSASRRM